MYMSKHKLITPVYTEIIAIVHGRSEYNICSYIKSNLRIKMEIIAENKGKYVNIFPINRGQADVEQIQEFNNKIKSVSSISNLNYFIEACLEVQRKYNEW